MKRRLTFLALAIYLLGFVLTFGHQGTRYTREGLDAAEAPAFFGGLVWPAYWPFRLSWDYFAETSP